MADIEPFDPRTVPHTLHKVRAGGGHEIPAQPRVILDIGEDGFVQEWWIQASPAGEYDLTSHLRDFSASRYGGAFLCNTSWALIFTPEGFEAVVTSKITEDSGPQTSYHGEMMVGGTVIEKVISLFPLVGFTTND